MRLIKVCGYVICLIALGGASFMNSATVTVKNNFESDVTFVLLAHHCNPYRRGLLPSESGCVAKHSIFTLLPNEEQKKDIDFCFWSNFLFKCKDCVKSQDNWLIWDEKPMPQDTWVSNEKSEAMKRMKRLHKVTCDMDLKLSIEPSTKPDYPWALVIEPLPSYWQRLKAWIPTVTTGYPES